MSLAQGRKGRRSSGGRKGNVEEVETVVVIKRLNTE